MSQPNAELIRALEQFNRGEYWEQHETLEVLWRAERDESMRDLYKGILQVGVGFYHITRRNYAGAVKVLGRGVGYLRRYVPWCQGVDVAQLIEESTQVLERLQALGATRIAGIDVNQLPRVHYRVE